MHTINNKSLLEECNKEENLEVTGAAATSCCKEDYKMSCPISHFRSVTVRPSPQ